MSIPARLYLDIISPFAYLYLKQIGRLSPELSVEYVPVLFAGLLKHWESKGPAEIPTKRQHTYQWCAWRAKVLGVPFRMPPRHPFNPLAGLRLLAGIGPSPAQFERAFDFVFAQGRDPERDFPGLCSTLGRSLEDANALISSPEVKAKLAANTEAAIAEGVFGVPSLTFRGQRFWGADTIDWANEFAADPALFEHADLREAAAVEFGVARRS